MDSGGREASCVARRVVYGALQSSWILKAPCFDLHRAASSTAHYAPRHPHVLRQSTAATDQRGPARLGNQASRRLSSINKCRRRLQSSADQRGLGYRPAWAAHRQGMCYARTRAPQQGTAAGHRSRAPHQARHRAPQHPRYRATHRTARATPRASPDTRHTPMVWYQAAPAGYKAAPAVCVCGIQGRA
jgi:hypothetical protein